MDTQHCPQCLKQWLGGKMCPYCFCDLADGPPPKPRVESSSELGAVSWLDALATSWERRASKLGESHPTYTDDPLIAQELTTLEDCAKELRAEMERASNDGDQP